MGVGLIVEVLGPIGEHNLPYIIGAFILRLGAYSVIKALRGIGLAGMVQFGYKLGLLQAFNRLEVYRSVTP